MAKTNKSEKKVPKKCENTHKIVKKIPCFGQLRLPGRLVTLGFLSRLQFQEPMIAHGTLQEPKSSTLPLIYRLTNSFQGHEVLSRKGNFP